MTSLGRGSDSGNNGFGEHIAGSTVLANYVCGTALLGGVFVGMGVGVVVVVFALLVVVVMVVTSVGVAAEDKKSDKVGGKAEGADDKDKLGVVNLGRVEESGDGLEDDGDAESNQEDGVEESTQNLCSQPLQSPS